MTWRDVGPEVWDLTAAPTLVTRLGEPARMADFAPDGARVAVAGPDGVSLWEAAGRFLRRAGPPVIDVAMAGDVVVAGTETGGGWLWRQSGAGSHSDSADEGVALAGPESVADPSLGVALTGDGATAVVGDRVWDVRGTPKLVSFLAGHEGWIADVAFAPGDRTLVTAGDDQSVIVWDLAYPGEPQARTRLTGHSGAVLAVAAGPGGVLVTGSGDQTAMVWHYADPPAHPMLPGAAQGLAVAGSRLLTRDADGHGTLWDSGKAVDSFADAQGGVALSADGRTALAGGLDGAVLRRPGAEIRFARGMRVRSVALSGDGSRALAGGPSGVVLWTDGREVPLPVTASAVALSADGALGVTSAQGALVAWDLRDQDRPVRGPLLAGHTDEVVSLAVRAGLVLSGGADRKAVLWEVTGPDTLRATGALLGHRGKVDEVALSPDGLVAATASRDENVAVWVVRDHSGPRKVHSLARSGPGLAFGPGSYEIFASNVRSGVTRWDFRYLSKVIGHPLEVACALVGCEKGHDHGGE